MKLSIIMPVSDDVTATARTCSNIIYQKGNKVDREVLVVADGPAKWARHVVNTANEKAQKANQPCEFKYLYTSQHSGTGNIGRALALKAAVGDWVCFIDTGTSVMPHAMHMIDFVHRVEPDSQIIAWDIVQMLDPAPFIHLSATLKNYVNDKSIGYYIPGVGAAVKREIAQSVPWPNIRTSDWLYFCKIWEKLDKPVRISCIQSVLVIAYGGYDHKRYRDFPEHDVLIKSGYDLPYEEAAAIHGYELPSEYMNGNSPQGTNEPTASDTGCRVAEPQTSDSLQRAEGQSSSVLHAPIQ
jgi:hypothetical protein